MSRAHGPAKVMVKVKVKVKASRSWGCAAEENQKPKKVDRMKSGYTGREKSNQSTVTETVYKVQFVSNAVTGSQRHQRRLRRCLTFFPRAPGGRRQGGRWEVVECRDRKTREDGDKK